MKSAAFILVVSSLLAAGAAAAKDRANCNSVSSDKELSDISLGAITARKLNFLANESEKPGCPSADPSCAKAAFVRAKDKVVFDTDVVAGGYVCAAFVDRRGNETSGWLPVADVNPVTVQPRWVGHWRWYSASRIDIARKSADSAAVSGSAVHGQGGAATEGSFEAVIDLKQAVQGFALQDGKQVAYREAGKYDCAVMMKQLGRYLFVSDNRNCGGANISFSNVYVRR
ncbi:hypothetical protein ACWGTI_27615 [Mesorhizobium sp. ArgA1]